MSIGLYPRRLYWDGRSGGAKWDGVEHLLLASPEIGSAAAEIDFAPGIVAQIRPNTWDRMRDMDAGEIAASRAYLIALA